MKKQILLFVLTLLPTLANAYDAEIKGIYYNLNSTTKKAEVTYHEVTYHDDYYTPYRGDIEIPSSVIYNGTEYTVTSIGVDAFAPHYDDDESYITSVTIPNSVTIIGDGAFSFCSGLTSIAIPSSVTTIVEEAFSGCTGLTSITIPSSVTSIESGAFQGCGGLTSVIIPNSVTLIGHHAFSGCTNLINVYCLAENVPAAASNSFPNNYITLYVPEASIDKYKTKSPWSGFKEIKALPDDMLEDPEIPGAERCATPSISFVDGQLTFACETEDVEFVPTVTCSPVYTLNGNKMKMGVTFNISVYARRDGYNKSDVATKTIEAKELGDVNGDGQLTISDITILVDKVMGRR